MTTLEDLSGRVTITVPEAGQLLGIGRDAAYAAAHRGEIPTLKLGRRLVVPTHVLLRLLGITEDSQAGVPENSEAGPDTGPAIASTSTPASGVRLVQNATDPAA